MTSDQFPCVLDEACPTCHLSRLGMHSTASQQVELHEHMDWCTELGVPHLITRGKKTFKILKVTFKRLSGPLRPSWMFRDIIRCQETKSGWIPMFLRCFGLVSLQYGGAVPARHFQNFGPRFLVYLSSE